MTREEIETKLKETVVSALDLEDLTPADIETDVPLFGEGLGLDSIDAVDLCMRLQQETKKKVTPEDFRQIRTLADVTKAVSKLVNES